MDTEIPSQDIWEVDANGKFLEAKFDDLAAWIGDGSLLRIDRVRRGNLRWIEAGKVPALIEFFNAKEAGEPIAPVVTTTNTEVLGVPPPQAFVNAPTPLTNGCSMHTDAPARYVCDTCSNQFCKACPTGYGSNVKICPFCGAMCRPLEEVAAIAAVAASTDTGSFGFSDFGKALAFPFRFKVSLVFGAVMFMIFSIGQGGGLFGGIFMLAAAIICFMMANMLTFGIMANTIDNFAKGDLDENFMPSFDDFNIWDDVVHPFFLSIGAYISSFGPFIVVVLVAVFLVLGSVKNGGLQTDAASTISPEYAQAPKLLSQGEQLKQLASNTADVQKQRVQAMQNGEIPPEQLDPQAMQKAEDERFEKMNKMIEEQRRGQLESSLGKAPETKTKEQQEMIKRIMGYGPIFLIIGGITLLWGLFYFPAACAVAGYTRSFAATLNPTVGLDTIKRLGGSYVLILVMCLMLGVASGFVSGIFSSVFSAFDLPSVGNLPAKALGSITGFYFWIVFSCILGYALFKNADKLKLSR
jgi:hypothetical protein